MVIVLLLIVLSPFILLALGGMSIARDKRKGHAQFVAMLKRTNQYKVNALTGNK
jgi:hypothetical protein